MFFRIFIAGLSLVLLSGAPLAAQQIVIDDFEAAGTTLILTATGTQEVNENGAVILQNERNLRVSGSGFGGGTSIDEGVSGGALNVIRTAFITTANAEAWWDGDNNTSVFNPVGLGGVDLTANGQDRFTISGATTNGSDAQQLELRVWTDGGNNSVAAFTLPTGGATFDILYSSFTPSAGAGATFTNVGAISLQLLSTAAGVWVFNLDDIRTTPVELMSFEVE
jgi:hypothetical protein